jgi:hypothetical protein
MTALPTHAYLRRYALPAHFLADLDIRDHPIEPAFRSVSPDCPHLVATWHVDAPGHLTCRWGVERVFCVSSG